MMSTATEHFFSSTYFMEGFETSNFDFVYIYQKHTHENQYRY